MADITSQADQANNQQKADQANKEFAARKAAGFGDSVLDRSVASPGDYGREKIYVLVDPNDNTSDIFGVSRYKEFTKDHSLPISALVATFAEKYGQPTTSKYGASFTWMAPGVLEKTRNPPVNCTLADSSSYLYENPRITQLSIGQAFSSSVNNIKAGDTLPRYNLTKCGTVLQLSVELSNDRQYATNMSVVLIDLAKGQAELKQFAADFFAHADAAKQQKLSTDSLNKPKL